MLNEFSQGGTNYRLSLDVTTRFADGTPNPNSGVPFRLCATGRSDPASARGLPGDGRSRFRFQARLREGSLLSKMLGRHTLTGNFTSQDNHELTFNGGPMVDMEYFNIFRIRNAGTTTVANPRSDGPRSVNVITYYGAEPRRRAGSAKPKAFVDCSSRSAWRKRASQACRRIIIQPAQQRHRGAAVATQEVWGSRAWTGGAPEPVAQRGSKTYSDFRSLAAVMQSRWFENTLISTVGWRRDWVETFDALAVRIFTDAGRILADDSVWPLQPVLNQRHDAVNYGLALDVPKFIERHLPKSAQVSFLYNCWSNFTPQEARYSVYGKEIDPTMGETREYGVMVSLFNRKIELRASHYESSSSLATLDELPILEFDRFAHRTLTGIQDNFWDGVVPDSVMKAYMDFVRSPVGSVFDSPNVTGFYLDDAGRSARATDWTRRPGARDNGHGRQRLGGGVDGESDSQLAPVDERSPAKRWTDRTRRPTFGSYCNRGGPSCHGWQDDRAAEQRDGKHGGNTFSPAKPRCAASVPSTEPSRPRCANGGSTWSVLWHCSDQNRLKGWAIGERCAGRTSRPLATPKSHHRRTGTIRCDSPLFWLRGKRMSMAGSATAAGCNG